MTKKTLRTKKNIRKPLGNRVLSFRLMIPGFKGMIGLGIFGFLSIATVAIWKICEDSGQKLVQFLGDKGQVRLEKLVIEGRHYTKEDAVIQATGLKTGDPLFRQNPQDIQKRLLALPWIKAVTVRRQIPNQLMIRLVEQYPIALWQKKDQLSLIDDAGQVIQEIDGDTFSDLLIVTGEDAPRATPLLLEALQAYPHLKQRVTGAMFISKRRWDILVDNKIRVKLPEIQPEQGLDFFTKLEDHKDFDPQAILFVDVKDPKKAYVRYRKSPFAKDQGPDKPKKTSKQV